MGAYNTTTSIVIVELTPKSFEVYVELLKLSRCWEFVGVGVDSRWILSW